MASQAFLDEIRTLLVAEKRRLEGELLGIATKSVSDEGGYLPKWEEYGSKEDENAAEVAEYSVSLGVGQAFEHELADVELALAAIDQGTYGICETCGTHIDENRLRARPMSRYCVACQEKQDRA